MFVSTRDQGYSRRSRVYKHKTVSFSHISLLSRLTATSTGSGDSARTITQESFDQLRRGDTRPKRRTKRKKSRRLKSIDMTSQPPTDTISTDVNVFEFLDPDQPTQVEVVAELRQRQIEAPRRPSAHEHEESDKESTARSIFSDSAVSLNDSMTTSHSQTFLKTRLQPLPEYHTSQPPPQIYPTYVGHPFHPYSRGWPPNPLLRPPDGPPQHGSRMQPENAVDDTWHTGSPKEGSTHCADPPTAAYTDSYTTSGYSLVASKLTPSNDEDAPLPPLYRSFTKLNHRILLQLQDEIAQMESHLDQLDKEDNDFHRQAGASRLPSSRRMSWSWPESELQNRRLELLGQIYVKIEQYNQALVLAQKVTRCTTPATASEINHYAEWLQKHRPMAQAEMKYLDDHSDVLSLRTGHPSRSDSKHQPAQQLADYCSKTCTLTLFLSLVPLLLFKLTNDLVYRIVIICLNVAFGFLWKKQQKSSVIWANPHDLKIQIALLVFVALIF